MVSGDRLNRVLWRLLLATAAALGAATTAVLVAVPARVADAAEVTDAASAQTVAAGYTLLGVLAGLLLAAGALAARAVAANLLATTAWLWLLATVAVADGVISGEEWHRLPLAYWQFATAGPWFRSVLLPDAGVALGAALLIGMLAALPAARRGDRPAGIVISGAAGPLVVAAAYLLTQPDLTGAAATDLSRHLVAPYLVIAGLLGSLLISAVPGRTHTQTGAPTGTVSSPRDLAGGDAAEGGDAEAGTAGKRGGARKRGGSKRGGVPAQRDGTEAAVERT